MVVVFFSVTLLSVSCAVFSCCLIVSYCKIKWKIYNMAVGRRIVRFENMDLKEKYTTATIKNGK